VPAPAPAAPVPAPAAADDAMIFRQWFSARTAARQADSIPPPGLYAYIRKHEDAKTRIHLRVEEDGCGSLLINAAQIYQLNSTAISMAYLALEDWREDEVVRRLHPRFRITKKQLSQDYAGFLVQLEELIRPDGPCPICDLDVDVIAPFSARPSAPYRMDLALTYRCNNDCAHCYNPTQPRTGELSTEEWKLILDKLWAFHIPHIIFTGGEPTLRSDLPELIAYAEGLGQITGLNTNGRRLRDTSYLDSLVEAGLDHVQITLESHTATLHDRMVKCNGAWDQTSAGIRNALNSRLYVMTNTTMLRDNAPSLAETLDYLADLAVPTIGLNALIYSGRGKDVGSGLAEHELPALLEMARRKTVERGQRLIWYSPTEYCHFDPVLLDLGVKGCTAALYNMCVEPDGKVLPCQSTYQPVGDIRRDEWKDIWEHPLCIRLRTRAYAPPKCLECALFTECGGGCPLRIE
jgi:radical SAM protein with 4Fe4S-binding SPASM domain